MMLFSIAVAQVGRARSNIEADEHLLCIGQVTDNLADRYWQFPHQRRDGQNLVALRKVWSLRQVDDIDVIASSEILLTEFLEITQCGE